MSMAPRWNLIYRSRKTGNLRQMQIRAHSIDDAARQSEYFLLNGEPVALVKVGWQASLEPIEELHDKG